MNKDKLEACFNRLQTMRIQATLENMEILVQTLYDLRDLYNKYKEGEEDGRDQAGAE